MAQNLNYKAMTRERFLFHESRIVAKLLAEGKPREQVIEAVVKGNLFQYPTEKSLRQISNICLNRMAALDDDYLVSGIATMPANTAKQICAYSVMRENRLFYDFMTTVIGAKYRTLDYSFTRVDMSAFFTRMKEQVDTVAAWSDSSIEKTKSSIKGIMLATGLITSIYAKELNQIWLSSALEEAMRKNGDIAALAAFNCFV